MLGDGTNYASQVVWPWVRMAPYSCLFLRSSRLRCVDHHGPRGTHDILVSIPLTEALAIKWCPRARGYTTTSKASSASDRLISA